MRRLLIALWTCALAAGSCAPLGAGSGAGVTSAAPTTRGATRDLWLCDGSSGRSCARLHPDTRGAPEPAFEAGTHYLALGLERLLVPLPGVAAGTSLLAAVELSVEGHGRVRAVTDVATVGDNQTVELTELVRVAPFLYQGGPVDLRIRLVPIDARKKGNVQGQLQGAGDFRKRLYLESSMARGMGEMLFASLVLASPHGASPLADLRFRLSPEPARTGVPLRDGLVGILASELDPAPPLHLLRFLSLQGNWIELAEPGKPPAVYGQSAFVVLGIERHNRTADPREVAFRIGFDIGRLVDLGQYDAAEANIPSVASALGATDNTLSSSDRIALGALVELWRARITLGRALVQAQSTDPEERAAAARQVPSARRLVIAWLRHLLARDRAHLHQSEATELKYQLEAQLKHERPLAQPVTGGSK